jgi:hypothetical protein
LTNGGFVYEYIKYGKISVLNFMKIIKKDICVALFMMWINVRKLKLMSLKDTWGKMGLV